MAKSFVLPRAPRATIFVDHARQNRWKTAQRLGTEPHRLGRLAVGSQHRKEHGGQHPKEDADQGAIRKTFAKLGGDGDAGPGTVDENPALRMRREERIHDPARAGEVAHVARLGPGFLLTGEHAGADVVLEQRMRAEVLDDDRVPVVLDQRFLADVGFGHHLVHVHPDLPAGAELRAHLQLVPRRFRQHRL